MTQEKRDGLRDPLWARRSLCTGRTPGTAPAAIQQAGTAIGAGGTAASIAAPGLDSTAEWIRTVSAATSATTGLDTTAAGISAVSAAGSGAGGALAGLAGQIRALAGTSPAGAPAAVDGAPKAAGAAPAAPAAPGKSSSYALPAHSTVPATLTANLHMHGRRVAQSVTRHQVSSNDTRSHNSNRFKTSVGFSSPTFA